MSFAPPNDAKERIRQAIDIVDLAGGFMELRRQGRHYVAICPWHSDTRPSLQINPERQSWKCWVCDIGGDIFSFVMQREGIDFREAMEMLAERAGIELQAVPQAKIEPGSPQDKRTLYQCVAWAENQFHNYLLHDAGASAARQYLLDRGVSDTSIQAFRIGFAPDTWQWLCDQAKGTAFSPAVLAAAGLATKSERGSFFDFFRGRVMFPVRDVQDRPIAFGGRILPEIARQLETQGRSQGKYVNSTETRLYSKSDQLYALNVVRDVIRQQEPRQVVVVEGYTDVVMAHQAGLNNFVAVLGTALNERHIRLLRRFADTITLVLDGDDAGQTRTNQILELFIAAQIDLRILTLPQGLDPCDFVTQRGPDEFRQLLGQAPDALEHRVQTATAGIVDKHDTHSVTQALEQILATVAKAPRLQAGTADGVRLREQQIVTRLARTFTIPETELRARVTELRNRSVTGTRRSERRSHDSPAEVPLELNPYERELFELLIIDPILVPAAIERFAPDDLESQAAKQLLAVYMELEVAGEPLEFQRLLTEIENPALKHLIVELDEHSQQKTEHAEETSADRFHKLVARVCENNAARQRQKHIASLEDGKLNEQEGADLINQIIAEQRERQGVSSPTEG